MKLAVLAILLALAYNAAPGPVLAEATRRGLHSGFRAALAVELGSLAGDAFWVLLTLAGAAALAEAGGIKLASTAVSAALLLSLGVRALHGVRSGKSMELEAAPVEQAFATGAAISFASPYAIPFWVGVSGTISSYGLSSGGFPAYAAFSISFLLTCIVFAVAVATLIAWGRRFLRPRLFIAVDLVCGLALVALGVDLLSVMIARALGY